MNWLDWVILGIIILSTVAALGRGIFVEFCSLAGLAGGIVLACHYYDKIAAYFLTFVHAAALVNMAAFLLIVVVTLMLATWLGHVLHNLAKYTGMGWVDAFLGAVFGFVRGVLAVTAAMMALAAFTPTTTWTAHSRLATYFLSSADRVAVVAPADLKLQIEHGVWTLKHLSTLRLWL
jgi:membrane protein required for colicin V production